MEFFTIGVYNTTEDDFFNKLVQNRINTFCDIRQRRGVRGSKYAFVNSNRLQQKLTELDIQYGHVLKLAPTQEIRDLQKEADIQKGELKRERQQLGQVFVIAFKNKVINNFDFDSFIEKLDQVGANRVVLFCVEEHPEACHRSIVANRLKEQYNYKITHL
ncbi:MAG: Fe-S cluster assembly protein HesB [Segetibacter sp.]|nr:Fe-S cluster assembly protein HesB [Segetibacter sp.]